MQEELLGTAAAEPTYKVLRTANITGVVTGGKLRNTRSYTKNDEDHTVANWKVKLDNGQTHDYVAVFDTDADAFEAQVKAGEAINISQKYKERITIDANGHEVREPLAMPELGYDAPMGDVDAMFS
jgi:hypothetical protein